EDSDAESSSQRFFEFVLLVRDGLFALSASEIRMDNATLDWAWSDQCHFDDQVVERLWPHARKHRLLGARFNLKNAHRVRTRNHVVRGLVLRGDVLHLEPVALTLADKFQRLANGGK